jgi:hypothetical protein
MLSNKLTVAGLRGVVKRPIAFMRYESETEVLTKELQQYLLNER